MLNRLNKREREHVGRVKEMPCGVCGASGPSEAHHIVQHQQYTCIPLCESCHRSNFNGIHGQKRIWEVMKLDEMAVLNLTVQNLIGR